jgi:hypothetical protein
MFIQVRKSENTWIYRQALDEHDGQDNYVNYNNIGRVLLGSEGRRLQTQ